jgi:hypothetical protein
MTNFAEKTQRVWTPPTYNTDLALTTHRLRVRSSARESRDSQSKNKGPSIFGRFIRAFAGRAFSTGTAWCVEGNLGAALWLPPGVKPDADSIASILDESVARDVMANVNTMFAEMTAYHPAQPGLVPANDRC